MYQFQFWVLTFENVQASLAEARIRKWGGETERGDAIEEIKCEEDKDSIQMVKTIKGNGN